MKTKISALLLVLFIFSNNVFADFSVIESLERKINSYIVSLQEEKDKNLKEGENKENTNETTNEENMDKEVVSENTAKEDVLKKPVLERREPTVSYSSLPNKSYGWYFRHPSKLNSGLPAGAGDVESSLVKKYNGIWQHPKDYKVVYITFDEGYEYNNNTTRILDIAKQKGVKFNFFVTGAYIKDRPDLVLRMINEGHTVGNHTNKHLNGPKALNVSNKKLINDITQAEVLYKNLTGQDFMPYMRPPEGTFSERELAIVRDLGYRSVFWSFAYADWDTGKQPSKSHALSKITGELHNGSVILLHAVSTTNTEILPDIIDNILKRGYKVETLDKIPSYE